MSKPIIGGKKHISEKAAPKSAKDLFKPRNLLDISDELKAELEAAGLDYRWVDAKQMSDSGNMHRNHWQIYRRPTGTVSTGEQAFGLPPDGTVRRGTVVLAVRKNEISQGHREALREKTKRQTASVKGAARELRDMARKGGLNERIFDETEIE
jgi:hypothetical protein